MSIFKQTSKHKTEQKVIRVLERVEPRPQPHPAVAHARPPAAAPGPSAAGSGTNKTRGRTKAGSVRGGSLHASSPLPPSPSSGDETTSRKRKAVAARATPESARLSDDGGADGADDDDAWMRLGARKRPRQRRRAGVGAVDLKRRLRHPQLWVGGADEDAQDLRFTHAAELACRRQKCSPVLGLRDGDVQVVLQYPGARLPERYELVQAKDNLDVVDEIKNVVSYVASHYLSEEQREAFLGKDNDNTGIYRQLERSSSSTNRDGHGFKATVQAYNKKLLALQEDGVIANNIDAMVGATPESLAHFILEQCYNRTVAPHVELLQKYEQWTSQVYGELQHGFVSKILARTGVTSEHVFVDLGSGVGNVVLQAALEAGCESWGCELVENPCRLAEAQQREFTARCRLWGIQPGEFHLEQGDFTKNERILAVLKRADVVLVNNFVFKPELNNALVNMFLDLKIGCKVVSLKSFVHDQKNGSNDVAASIFDVEQDTYSDGFVSWSSASGTWFVSTRK